MENNPTEQEHIPTGLLILNGVLFLLVIIFAFLSFKAFTISRYTQNTKSESVVVIHHAFDRTIIEAKSAVVFDVVSNKIIYAKNPSAQLPLASLTKLMTALVAVESVPQNSGITIHKEFLVEDGDNGLLPGETWTLKNLLDFSLIVSSNDGARSIASVVGSTLAQNKNYDIGRSQFIGKMNQRAVELGLAETYFINESGLDESASQSGAYGSAEDVAHLMNYLLHNHLDVLEATKYPSTHIESSVKKHSAINTDTALKDIPGVLASKTGYTALAGGNLAIAFDAGIGHPIIVVVLGSTQNGRFSDALNLIHSSLDYIKE